MARRDRKAAGRTRLEALLDAGDFRSASAEVRRVLADAAAPEAERAAALEAGRRLGPEPGALWAGALAAAAVAVAVALGLLHR